jgi:hypothetical protein
MRQGLAILVLALLCMSFVHCEKAKEVDTGNYTDSDLYNETEDDDLLEEGPKSLFESPCAYKNLSVAVEEFCEQISLSNNYQIEVLMPVHSEIINDTILVPFLIRPQQKRTTFSKKAMEALKINNDRTNVVLGEITFRVTPGDENIIGLDFLDNCMLAVDYFAFEAGISVKKGNETIFSLNWPLESFKNAKLKSKTEKLVRKYKKMVYAVKKVKKRHAKKLTQLQEEINERNEMIAEMQRKNVAEKATPENATPKAAPKETKPEEKAEPADKKPKKKGT